MLKKVLLFIYLVLLSLSGFSQQVKNTNLGTAKGLIRDSLLNFGLPSATLAIYKKTDSSLVAYQLSNNAGEFQFTNVPLGIELKIIATYIGYKSMSRAIFIDPLLKNIDLKTFNLYKDENLLFEVEIKGIAPIRMNGDTLEFNADAFKLDENAVTEDLLRKLPGVVVWGDGTITVNGKEIKSLLVNGKPFFGGDAKVSTQNIPKNALEKVQVYRTDIDPNNPLDTITEVNLKLKKEKSMGYFGKAGAGIGTQQRFEADANINFFDSQNQIGLVGAANNINKTAINISTLLRNSTFKGVGASIDYQPNFKARGLTRSNSGGLLFQHDFIPNQNAQDKSRLYLNYFVNDLDNTSQTGTDAKTSIGGNVNQLNASTSKYITETLAQDAEVKYENRLKNYNYNINGTLSESRVQFSREQLDSVSNNSIGLQSLRNLEGQTRTANRNFSFGAALQHFKSRDSSPKLPGNWLIDYLLEGGDSKQDQKNQTDFISMTDPSKNSYFNRLNKSTANYSNHRINTKLGDLSSLVFGTSTAMHNNIGVEILNSLKISRKENTSNIYDLSQNSVNGVLNDQLSGTQLTDELDERPSLRLSKGFNSMLANRFSKSLAIDINLQGQFYGIRNSSSQSFQNFRRDYQKFIPQASVSYSNFQYGHSKKDLTLSYLSSYDFPSPDQLYPIVDLSNIYDVRLGNGSLSPSHSHQFSLNYRFMSQRSKQTFSYNLGPNITLTDNNHSYYTISDKDGRSTYSLVNLEGYRSMGFTGELIKAFKKMDNLAQIKFNTSLNLNKVPILTQNFEQSIPTLSFNENFSTSSNLLLFYSFKDLLAININQNFSTFSTKLSNSNGSRFLGTNQITSLAASLKFSPKLAMASNIDYNHTTFTGTVNNNFAIWNANATYRFMKGNNLEAKLSAMDILRQNRSITTIVNGNTIKQSRVNVLQQYFMFTLSYYPRKFGKKVQNAF